MHMKQLAVAMMAVWMMMVWPATAQQPGSPEERDRQQIGRDRPPSRDAVWRARHGQDEQEGGRMSREERKQLRRDINSHGRDIYRQDRGRH